MKESIKELIEVAGVWILGLIIPLLLLTLFIYLSNIYIYNLIISLSTKSHSLLFFPENILKVFLSGNVWCLCLVCLRQRRANKWKVVLVLQTSFMDVILLTHPVLSWTVCE